MNAQELAAAAEVFLEKISSIEGRLVVAAQEVVADAGTFNNIFRDTHKEKPGVYWFFIPNQSVFYIGKSEVNVWIRICSHTKAAVWAGPGPGDYKNGTGEGWRFPNSKYLDFVKNVATETAILEGKFHVGWAAVDPEAGYFASLLETYLQTLFFASSNRQLPELCRKIG